MQQIARELNNSETAFILPAGAADHDLHIRYFTPRVEVPICGHATMAALHIYATEQQLTEADLRIKTGAGILPMSIRQVDGRYLISMQQGQIQLENPFTSPLQEQIIAALGAEQSMILSTSPLQIVSTGHSKVMIPFRDRRDIDALKPNMSALSALSRQIGCNGYFAFTVLPDQPELTTYGRMFAPAIGIDEDPVTGNANGPLGAYLVAHGLVEIDRPVLNFTATQGHAVQRPGQMQVEVEIREGKAGKVRIEGTAVTVYSTELTLE